MGRNKRGRRDGTGPYKTSYRARHKLKGRRREAGVECPKPSKSKSSKSKPKSRKKRR